MQSAVVRTLLAFAIVPLLLLPVLVGTCGKSASAQPEKPQEPASDILTAGQ